MKNLPDTVKIDAQGHFEVGGCSVVALAEEFGTPLYVMDETTIRNNCRSYLSAFSSYYPNVEIAYASKALCNIAVAKVIASEGLGFDVSSGGELYTVLRAGADPKKIYFHGNNKSMKEIQEGLKAGVGRFVVDNEEELERLDQASRKANIRAEILFRINPGIEAHTHEFVQTGKTDSKFGIQLDKLEQMVGKVARLEMVELKGFHAHIGSQIFETKGFIAATELLLSLTDKYQTEELNIGGGIGIAYLPKEAGPTVEVYAREIAKILKGRTSPKLILEPGRSIVGTAGVTIYTIGAVREIPGVRKYLLIDGGMSDNPRFILYGAKYDALIGNKANQLRDDLVTVGGRFCESGDLILKDIKLQKADSGDLLVVLCTGAYNYSMASNYNRVGRPAMVMVKKGNASIMVKRETYEDLVLNDAA